MQVTLNAGSPAESRLIAAFLHDLADLQELRIAESNAWMQQHGFATTAPSAPTQAEAAEAIAPVKKSRGKKEPAATTAEASSTAPASETSAGAPESAASTTEAGTTQTEGNASATTAEPAAESGSSESAEPAAKDYSTDDLRKLFGDLAQKGRRDKAVLIVRSYGFNGIAAITADKQNEIGAKLDALLAEPEEV